MDPSLQLAQISETPLQPDRLPNLAIDPGSDLTIYFQDTDTLYENSDIRVRIVKLEDAIRQLPQITKKKRLVNPFSGLFQYQFASSMGLNLASIDANRGVNGYFNLIREFNDDEFFYATTGDSGEIPEYVQYRRPNSVGYGLGKNWRDELFSRGGLTGRPNFVPYNGTPNDFLNTLQLQFEDGLHVFYGFSGDLVEDSLLALSTLRTEGNLVLRTQELTSVTSEFDHDLLFVLATVFKNLTILKPLSSDPTSSEQFIIGTGLRPSTRDQIQVLETVRKESNVESFLKVPENFHLQVQEITDGLLRSRQNALYAILAEEKMTKPEYRLDRVLESWGVSRNRRKTTVLTPDMEPVQY